MRAALNSRKRLQAPARTPLLVGLLVCGVFGEKLITNNKGGIAGISAVRTLSQEKGVLAFF